MKNLDNIANELFDKIRGRFPSVTVGNSSAEVTNEIDNGRFFEFDFTNGKKVSVSLDEDSLTIMYSKNLFSEHEDVLKSKWFDFLKELRIFAKKRMLNFDTRDITKNNLDKRDYEYLSTERQMSESKLYGTSRTSYQNIGTARMVVKHSAPINQESATGRNTNIHSIYIESDAGERFKYPYKHMNGARALAMHVSEGGNPYDDFGKHVTGLSEELSKLRKFKTYMNRSSVMAEGLQGYLDVVNDRINTVKKTIENIQRPSKYKEMSENFEATILEEVPAEVSNSWIDELTIRQFNEELKDVFPYIYKLVSEANKPGMIGPDELATESGLQRHIGIKKYGKKGFEELQQAGREGASEEEKGAIKDKHLKKKDESEIINPEAEYASHLDDIISSAEHEQDPNEAYANAFEDFKMAAANAAAKGEKEFEYPAGSGKKHPVKMDKGTAAKMLADSMYESHFLDEGIADKALIGVYNGLKSAGSGLLGALGKPQVKKGLSDVASTVAQGTKTAVKGATKGYGTAFKAMPKTTTIGTAVAVDQAGIYDVGGAISNAITGAGSTVVTGAGDLVKGMGDGLANMVPNLEDVARVASKYALPVGLTIAAIFGGKMILDKLFKDDDKKETSDDATTIDLSPKGKGDEMKQKNEIPLDEYIKSMYDYVENSFPKGETAVLTHVQKTYGDNAVNKAQEIMVELLQGNDEEMSRIQQLAGVR